MLLLLYHSFSCPLHPPSPPSLWSSLVFLQCFTWDFFFFRGWRIYQRDNRAIFSAPCLLQTRETCQGKWLLGDFFFLTCLDLVDKEGKIISSWQGCHQNQGYILSSTSFAWLLLSQVNMLDSHLHPLPFPWNTHTSAILTCCHLECFVWKLKLELVSQSQQCSPAFMTPKG